VWGGVGGGVFFCVGCGGGGGGGLCKSLFSLRRRATEFQRIGMEGGKVEQEEIKRFISIKH